ncbi:MAG: hypothetical protein WCH34_03170 [Bacteroidota bacterium]
MAGSQRSFESRKQRFTNANEGIQGKSDYDPNRDLIKKAILTAFIASLNVKDAAVLVKINDYREKARLRRINCFREKGCLDNCLENRIRNAYAYVCAEFGRDSSPARIIKAFLAMIAPVYVKKDPNSPDTKGKSPSEKSFGSLINKGKEIAAVLDDLGADYNPSDPDISAASILALCELMDTYSKNIAKAEVAWSKAVSERKDLYDGPEGMTERIKIIKDYLASFPGGKKNQDYKDFCRLIAGR